MKMFDFLNPLLLLYYFCFKKMHRYLLDRPMPHYFIRNPKLTFFVHYITKGIQSYYPFSFNNRETAEVRNEFWHLGFIKGFKFNQALGLKK